MGQPVSCWSDLTPPSLQLAAMGLVLLLTLFWTVPVVLIATLVGGIYY
jgi:hypothetical protein